MPVPDQVRDDGSGIQVLYGIDNILDSGFRRKGGALFVIPKKR
jgi:hypothetical protein